MAFPYSCNGWLGRLAVELLPPSVYNDGLDLSNFFSSMHKLIVFSMLSFIAYGASVHGEQTRTPTYRDALSLMWGVLYRDGGKTLYCEREFGRKKGRRINVEHVLPMSWVAYAFKCGRRDECRASNERFNHAEADLHNMWPSRVDVNKARRSYPFALIKGESRPFRGCDFEFDERLRLAEPRPLARGEIARAMFYMSDAYDVPIRPQLTRLLKQWHKDDPASAEEHRRNTLIERLQGTRNRFIDDASLVNRIRD